MNELGMKTSLVYKVETNYPDASKPDHEDNSFNSYYAWAYTDVREPGSQNKYMLINTQKELFDKRIGESLIFENLDDAKKVANFLREYGRIGSGWNGNERWHMDRRGPLKVRIVEEYSTISRHVVIE